MSEGQDQRGRVAPIVVAIAVAVISLVGTVIASYLSVEASQSTVEVVEKEFDEKAKADRTALRRTTYISYLVEVEKFYNSDSGDESRLRLEAAKAVIVATPEVRKMIEALDRELMRTVDRSSKNKSEETYLMVRAQFLDAAAAELANPDR